MQLVKEIFEGYGYNITTQRLPSGAFSMDVYWCSPLSAAWAETKDIIEAQAAHVLQAQQQSTSGGESDVPQDIIGPRPRARQSRLGGRGRSRR